MDLIEYNNRFLKLEEDLDIFNKRVRGVYFWEKIRFHINNLIEQKVLGYGKAGGMQQRSLLYRLRRWFFIIVTMFYRNPYFSGRRDIVFIGYPRRRLEPDGRWWDKYFDQIIDSIGQSCVKLEFPTEKGWPLTPVKTRDIRYLNTAYFLSLIIGLFVKIRLDEADRRTIGEINFAIEAAFGVRVDVAPEIVRMLALKKSYYWPYTLLFWKIRPKYVFLVCSYDTMGDFYGLCRQRGIKLIELQHGSIHRYHYGYSFRPPARPLRHFPDYLLTFGEYWHKSADLPLPPQNIIAVGYPYFEKEINRYKDVKKEKIIVVLSQGTVGWELSKFTAKLAQRDLMGYTIVYKLHPFEYDVWRELYPWLQAPNITVAEDRVTGLHPLLARASIQCGVYSTAVYEGLTFGCRTYLIDLPGVEAMEYLIARGFARKISRPEEVDLCGVVETDRGTGNEIFKMNWESNLKQALKTIIKPRDGKIV